jgi:hypothetical protein
LPVRITLVGWKGAPDVGHLVHELRPTDLLAEVVVDLLEVRGCYSRRGQHRQCQREEHNEVDHEDPDRETA